MHYNFFLLNNPMLRLSRLPHQFLEPERFASDSIFIWQTVISLRIFLIWLIYKCLRKIDYLLSLISKFKEFLTSIIGVFGLSHRRVILEETRIVGLDIMVELVHFLGESLHEVGNYGFIVEFFLGRLGLLA